jgi:hypothetical protein
MCKGFISMTGFHKSSFDRQVHHTEGEMGMKLGKALTLVVLI